MGTATQARARIPHCRAFAQSVSSTICTIMDLASARSKLTPWPLGIAVYQRFAFDTRFYFIFFLPLQYILVTLFINAIRDGSRSNHFSYRTIVECAISPRIEEAQKKLTRVIGNYRPRFSRGDSANHRENCSRLRISVLASIFNRG